ncbi:recombinase family protein [Acetobacter sacchari]|uniref:Recombinase family protein n=1 Tax=Acetobacter sacchari TaxID=2661687 RepID=A0ABS3LZU5_9PROT|nr:recombinase family protein [Acetobacter sacchari]MBO1361415.1 recombinase family protein [Acetobacter sacchari]
MRIGYARVSTTDQYAGLAAQERDLEAAGCERVFAERASGAQGDRPELARALDMLREGDTLVVTKPDRLARSTTDLLGFVEAVRAKGGALHVLSMSLNTADASPTGTLLLTMLAAVAQFERDIMKERQAEGIAKAREEGKYKGRKPTARAQADKVQELAAQGVGATEIARRLNIGRNSVYRCMGKDF